MNRSFDLPLVTVDDFSDILRHSPSPTTNVHLKNYGISSWVEWTDNGQQADSGVDDENDEDEKIHLPSRYVRLTKSGGNCSRSYGSSVGLSRGDSTDNDDAYAPMEGRERDLSIALRWIRQEMICMRKQNKALLKQFTDLRASILRLRYTGDAAHGSLSDLSSVDGSSTSSLNEKGNATPLHRLTVGREPFLITGKQSVSLPCSPMVERSRRGFGVVGHQMCESDWDVEGIGGDDIMS